jgi:hypothetical protein
VLSLSLLAACAGRQEQPGGLADTPEERAVLKSANTYFEAWRVRDWSTVYDHLHKPYRDSISRGDFLAMPRDLVLRGHEITAVRMQSENKAATDVEMDISIFGQRLDDQQSEYHWVKEEDGKWRAVLRPVGQTTPFGPMMQKP